MNIETIAAISTAMGEGAIGIVRLSGPEALAISDKVFASRSGKKLCNVNTHTIHYGFLNDPLTGVAVEEVLVSVLKAPNTFTREDVVEINCHGGIVSINRVLQLVLDNGARLAEPGEFTKRAFINGRIDLTQAEAIIDLIRAKSDKAMDVALRQLEGSLSVKIRSLRELLLEALAQVEVNIDYPEYDDVEEMTHQALFEKGTEVKDELIRILRSANQGKVLREGVSTAIIGRPNVGKSSLMNVLAREEKAIVTEIAGTTRDVIEEYVTILGIPLKLVDTAGIRETDDIVEKIGVEKSRETLEKSDLVLVLLDGSRALVDEDIEILKMASDKNPVVVINKSDLEQKIDENILSDFVSFNRIVRISALEDKGIEALEDVIKEMFESEEVATQDQTYVSNVRHITLLKQSLAFIESGLEAIEMGVPVDLVQIDFTNAWELLGEIIGENVHEGLIDQLFSKFCLGK